MKTAVEQSDIADGRVEEHEGGVLVGCVGDGDFFLRSKIQTDARPMPDLATEMEGEQDRSASARLRCDNVDALH